MQAMETSNKRLRTLSDSDLCTEFTGACKYFFIGFTAGMSKLWGEKVVDL